VAGFGTAIAAGIQAGTALHQANSANAQQSDAMGYLNVNSGEASDYNDLMTYFGDAGVANAQGMLDEWESAFGSIQDNLSDYYNNLDPLKFSQESKTAYAQNLDKQMKQLNEGLAQRGITTSGQRAQLEKEAAFEKARTNASIDINAPEQVAQMKQSWLNRGDASKSRADQAVIGALGNQATYAGLGKESMMNANTNMANVLTGQASQSAVGSAAAAGAAGGMLGKAWDQYSSSPSNVNSNSSSSTDGSNSVDAGGMQNSGGEI